MQTLYNMGSAQYKAAHFPELSKRHLMDSVPATINHPISYMEYLKSYGITTEKDYIECPLLDGGGRNTQGRERHRITDYKVYRELYHPPTLAEHISDILSDLNKGPLFGVFVMPQDFSRYTGGVIVNYQEICYNKLKCELQWFGTHAVMIISCGITNTSVPFWLCLNNWGPNCFEIIRISMSKVHEIWSMTTQATLLSTWEHKAKSNEVVSLVTRIASGGRM